MALLDKQSNERFIIVVSRRNRMNTCVLQKKKKNYRTRCKVRFLKINWKKKTKKMNAICETSSIWKRYAIKIDFQEFDNIGYNNLTQIHKLHIFAERYFIKHVLIRYRFNRECHTCFLLFVRWFEKKKLSHNF